MNRKTFIRKTSVGILLGIPTVSLLGCSGSDDSSPPNSNPDPTDDTDDIMDADCVENGTNTSISANHGHNLTVSKEDVEAGSEKTYTLSQASTDSHVHQVTISEGQFSTLKNNEEITITSTSDAGHTHSVNVRCA